MRNKKPIIVKIDNKVLTRCFNAKHIPPSHWNFCDKTLHFHFVLALVPAHENPAANNLSRLEVGPEDRIQLELTDSIRVFKVEVDIASKTPKQEEDVTDYYHYDEVDENIREPQLNTSDDKTSSQVEHEQPTATKNDVH